MNTKIVRLQKYLSECGIASRRAAEKLIVAGKVKINGEVVTTLGTKCDPRRDRVEVEGERIKAFEKGIILLHKPTGVICSMKDPQGRRDLTHYITQKYRSYFPVGRLDRNSSGLLIVTNDGDLAETLLHPRYELPRVYEAWVDGSVSKERLAKLASGVRLDDGMAFAQAEIQETIPDQTLLKITVKEGRNHLVRRMMKALGHPVIGLKRISHGPFRLGTLRPGQIRKLTDREANDLSAKVLKR